MYLTLLGQIFCETRFIYIVIFIYSIYVLGHNVKYSVHTIQKSLKAIVLEIH